MKKVYHDIEKNFKEFDADSHTLERSAETWAKIYTEWRSYKAFFTALMTSEDQEERDFATAGREAIDFIANRLNPFHIDVAGYMNTASL